MGERGWVVAGMENLGNTKEDVQADDDDDDDGGGGGVVLAPNRLPLVSRDCERDVE